MEKTFLFGASGHGKVVKDIVEARGGQVEAFVDDNRSVSECGGTPVVHDAGGLSPMIVTIGVNKIRKVVVEKILAKNPGARFATAVHPSVVVSPSAKIGEGTVVMAGAVINAGAVIGKHCIINTGASVDHECVIGDYCHIAPHATLCGQVKVGEGALMGVGSCAVPCVKVGAWSTVGAGAAVVCDVPDGVVAVGVPARIIKDKDMNDKKLEHVVGGGKTLVISGLMLHKRFGYAA